MLAFLIGYFRLFIASILLFIMKGKEVNKQMVEEIGIGEKPISKTSTIKNLLNELNANLFENCNKIKEINNFLLTENLNESKDIKLTTGKGWFNIAIEMLQGSIDISKETKSELEKLSKEAK